MRTADDEESQGRVDDLIAGLGWDVANRYRSRSNNQRARNQPRKSPGEWEK